MSPGSRQIEERQATGETARVFHDIRQTMRVDGINLNFRTLATFKEFPALWDALQPSVATLQFEAAADTIRAAAVRFASDITAGLEHPHGVLGASQVYRLRHALKLYHYINPKLLIFMALAKQVLEKDTRRASSRNFTRLRRGIPVGMHPMEMSSAAPTDAALRALFDDIRATLALPAINSDYRTLALWPDWLHRFWGFLKPLIGRDAYAAAARQVRAHAQTLAQELPLTDALAQASPALLGANNKRFVETVATFERLLPSLVLNIAIAELGLAPAQEACLSPFPAQPLEPRT